MRSLILASVAAFTLSGCGGVWMHMVEASSLPPYEGDASKLYVLTPNTYEVFESNRIPGDEDPLAGRRTREAGRFAWDVQAAWTKKKAPILLVDNWVVTQPELDSDSGQLRIAQTTSKKSDSLTVYKSDYHNGYFFNAIIGSRAQAESAYVFNTRYFGFYLSDHRFVFFDRLKGKFLDTGLDAKEEHLVYVDDDGQPYFREKDYYKPFGPIRKIRFDNNSLTAPLSPTEVFPVTERGEDYPKRKPKLNPPPSDPEVVAQGAAVSINNWGAMPEPLEARVLCELRDDYLILRAANRLALLDGPFHGPGRQLVARHAWDAIPVQEQPMKDHTKGCLYAAFSSGDGRR